MPFEPVAMTSSMPARWNITVGRPAARYCSTDPRQAFLVGAMDAGIGHGDDAFGVLAEAEQRDMARQAERCDLRCDRLLEIALAGEDEADAGRPLDERGQVVEQVEMPLARLEGRQHDDDRRLEHTNDEVDGKRTTTRPPHTHRTSPIAARKS